MTLPELIKASQHLVSRTRRNKLPNGLICLKGGELDAEIAAAKRDVLNVPLTDFFTEEYFKTKSLLYTTL
jgi:16S rRNA (guanine527-N7)-methyltransferase